MVHQVLVNIYVCVHININTCDHRAERINGEMAWPRHCIHFLNTHLFHMRLSRSRTYTIHTYTTHVGVKIYNEIVSVHTLYDAVYAQIIHTFIPNVEYGWVRVARKMSSLGMGAWAPAHVTHHNCTKAFDGH